MSRWNIEEFSMEQLTDTLDLFFKFPKKTKKRIYVPFFGIARLARLGHYEFNELGPILWVAFDLFKNEPKVFQNL